ncbi:unnamed protein product, partial [Nesidiocoris tenuis]
MDFVQTQHGHGFQPFGLDGNGLLRQAFLLLRRLQLGLEPSASVPDVPQSQTDGDGHARSEGFPYRRMVRIPRYRRNDSAFFFVRRSGVHHKKANCESTAVISKVQKVLANAAKHLYPSHLTITYTTITKKSKVRKGNGGWGDVRDHQLCMNMTMGH